MERLWSTVRDAVKTQEQRIEDEYGLSIDVYGTGSQGYKLLNSCLNHGEYRADGEILTAGEIWNSTGRRKQILRKQMHEYWTFLLITDYFLDGHWYEGDDTIYYEPTSGSNKQHPTLPTPSGTLFVEPCLSGYDDEVLFDEWESQLQLLHRKDTRNVRPDFLITEPRVEAIPWGVWLWHSAGLADEDAFEDQWCDFRDKARWIVECKHTEPTEKDLSQILWYAVAYQTSTTLIVQDEVDNSTKHRFHDDAVAIDSPVHLIDGFQMGDRESCKSQLSTVFGGT